MMVFIKNYLLNIIVNKWETNGVENIFLDDKGWQYVALRECDKVRALWKVYSVSVTPSRGINMKLV